MSHYMISPGPMARGAERILGRRWLLLGISAVCLLVSVVAQQDWAVLAALSTGTTLLILLVILSAICILSRSRRAQALALIQTFVEQDVLPAFVTDSEGAIRSRNAAARGMEPEAITLAAVLEARFANPGAVLFRVQTKAAAHGHASEDAVARRGHTRLNAHRLEEGAFLWRIEDLADRHTLHRPSAGGVPLLTVGRSDAILSMNDAARRMIGERVKSLDRVFTDLPVRPGQVHVISTIDGPKSCLVAQSEGQAGRREVYLMPTAQTPDDRSGWAVFEDLPVALLEVTAQGTIAHVNAAAKRLMAVQECEGRHLGTLMEGLGRSITDWLADAASGKLSQNSEFLRLTQTPHETFVQVTLHRSRGAGAPTLVAVLNDATEFKALEAQFTQSQKMEAIGALAGGVAHDFNNLLTAITGHCDLLLLRHDQGDPDFADLVQINQNANRAAALVGQLLAFSRKQTLRPEVLDMRDALADLIHLLNRLVGEKVMLTLSHDPVLPMIRADKRQIEQVVMNLVVNARDAMPDGGEIRIETEEMTLTTPLERDRAVVPSGSYVVIRVSDSGVGIPEPLRQKVFEPFFTTKKIGQGTGLGLSTVYGIVKQSGGFIFLDSEVGVGSSFSVYLPSHTEQIAATVAAPVPKEEPQSRPEDGVVLLVEDEAPVRAFAARALRLRGYTVLEADSAEEALRLLEDRELHVDLFVTDVVMPGMDGPSWVQKALRNRPDVQVVFVSGYAEESFGEAQDRIPNSVFLPKPFSLSELTLTVQSRLH